MALILTSTAFRHESEIPIKYTCEGDNISPPLRWQGIPTNSKSLALLMEDPDAPDPLAPKMIWVHWMLYNIPVTAKGFAADAIRLPRQTKNGQNSWHEGKYSGPCPGVGKHRYFFKLYALDCILPDLKNPDRDKLLKNMKGHIIAQAQLMGTYKKQKP